MKKLIIATLSLVVLAGAGCTKVPQTANDNDSTAGCYVMKNKTKDKYSCFGCVGDKCKDPDTSKWEDTDQAAAADAGYTCVEKKKKGCTLKEAE